FLALSFFLPPSAALLSLHSFPTRRSSDLFFCIILNNILRLFFSTNEKDLFTAACNLLHDSSRFLQALGCFIQVNDVNTFFLSKKDRKSTRLNSSHVKISYAVFCLKKKKII